MKDNRKIERLHKEIKKELKQEMQNRYNEIKKELVHVDNKLVASNTHKFECYIDGAKDNLNRFLNITADDLEIGINELCTKSIVIHKGTTTLQEQKAKDYLFNVLRVRFIKTQVSKILENIFYGIFILLNFDINIDEYGDFDITQRDRKLDVKAVKVQQRFGFNTKAIINNDTEAKNQLISKLCKESYNKTDDEEKIFFITLSQTDNAINRTKSYLDFRQYVDFLKQVRDTDTLDDYSFCVNNANNETIKGYAFFFITD